MSLTKQFSRGFDTALNETKWWSKYHIWAAQTDTDTWCLLAKDSDGMVRMGRSPNMSHWNLSTWITERPFSARRVVFGPGSSIASSYIAWTSYGDVLVSPHSPTSVLELANSAEKFCTHLRMAALGVDGTYIMIWEDGTIRWDLKTHYDQLDSILNNLSDQGEEVTFVALNPWKAGDYFVYFDSRRLAC